MHTSFSKKKARKINELMNLGGQSGFHEIYLHTFQGWGVDGS